ncbi:MAG: hydrogenase maturation protease [Microthrixaceae bacterium]
MTAPRVLVVGVGNVLHGDDGFGVEVARRLTTRELPARVTVAETGIGGIHLVHELMAGYDALVVVDAVDRGRPPGTVMVIDAEVINVDDLDVEQRHDLLADMHLATPERALMVAKAVGVLPRRTIIIGCQPVEIETLGVGLSDEVTEAVDVAAAEIERCIQELSTPDPEHPRIRADG